MVNQTKKQLRLMITVMITILLSIILINFNQQNELTGLTTQTFEEVGELDYSYEITIPKAAKRGRSTFIDLDAVKKIEDYSILKSTDDLEFIFFDATYFISGDRSDFPLSPVPNQKIYEIKIVQPRLPTPEPYSALTYENCKAKTYKQTFVGTNFPSYDKIETCFQKTNGQYGKISAKILDYDLTTRDIFEKDLLIKVEVWKTIQIPTTPIPTPASGGPPPFIPPPPEPPDCDVDYPTPTGYAPPCDVFNVNPATNKARILVNPIVGVFADRMNQYVQNLQISAQQRGGYIWKEGYRYDANINNWIRFTFDQPGYQGSNWIIDQASTELLKVPLTAVRPDAPYANAILVFSCKKYGGKWRCGCTESDKTMDASLCEKWMMRQYTITLTPPPFTVPTPGGIATPAPTPMAPPAFPGPIDTTPPVRYNGLINGQPSGTTLPSTTDLALELSTDEPATCKYQSGVGYPYDSTSMLRMQYSADGRAHRTLITIGTVPSGTVISYQVKCADAAGNKNIDDYIITAKIGSGEETPPTPPPLPGNYVICRTPPGSGATITGVTDPAILKSYCVDFAVLGDSSKTPMTGTDVEQSLIGSRYTAAQGDKLECKLPCSHAKASIIKTCKDLTTNQYVFNVINQC